MPIIQTSASVPLSNYWTYQQIVSEAMVLTNTIDNENIQLDNVRNHLNANLSYIANLLNLASSPWYGVWIIANLEVSLHPSYNMEWINLSSIVSGNVFFNPATQMHSIKRLNVSASTPVLATDWVGNSTKLDISQITMLDAGLNNQWRHSVAWAHHGSEIILYFGIQIGTPSKNAVTTPYLINGNQNIGLTGYRKPLLDNLIAPNIANGVGGQNYYSNVDLPDEYIDLLIKMTQKRILEQIREQVPQALEAEINQGVATINQMVSAELQFEASEREKRRYGGQQKAPGGVA